MTIPQHQILRAEANAMADAFVEALVSLVPEGTVVGAYVKGSSQRPWDGLIDYVPEVSDVDLHVRLAPDAPATIRALPFALAVGPAALEGFRGRFPDALHTPRPQLFFMEDIESAEGYLPSPPGSVRTLLGEPYRPASRGEYAATRQADAVHFTSNTEFFRDDLPGKVIDRPGAVLWRLVMRLSWRVGPSAPRVLTQVGRDPFEVWSWNRSALVSELIEEGLHAVADAYRAFYMAGWDGFRSGFTDPAAARRAIVAAHDVHAEGLKVF